MNKAGKVDYGTVWCIAQAKVFIFKRKYLTQPGLEKVSRHSIKSDYSVNLIDAYRINHMYHMKMN